MIKSALIDVAYSIRPSWPDNYNHNFPKSIKETTLHSKHSRFSIISRSLYIKALYYKII